MTHITIKDERVAAIVSESALAMSQLLGALLTSEMAASALPAVLPAAFPWASSLPEDHLKAFAGELREAVVAGSPERVERVLVDWRAVAEVRAGALHLSGRAAPSGSVTRNGPRRLVHASLARSTPPDLLVQSPLLRSQTARRRGGALPLQGLPTAVRSC